MNVLFNDVNPSHPYPRPPSWPTPWLSGCSPRWSRSAGRSLDWGPPPSSGRRLPSRWGSQPTRGNLCDQASCTEGFQNRSRSQSRRRTCGRCSPPPGCLGTARQEPTGPPRYRRCTGLRFPCEREDCNKKVFFFCPFFLVCLTLNCRR